MNLQTLFALAAALASAAYLLRGLTPTRQRASGSCHGCGPAGCPAAKCGSATVGR